MTAEVYSSRWQCYGQRCRARAWSLVVYNLAESRYGVLYVSEVVAWLYLFFLCSEDSGHACSWPILQTARTAANEAAVKGVSSLSQSSLRRTRRQTFLVKGISEKEGVVIVLVVIVAVIRTGVVISVDVVVEIDILTILPSKTETPMSVSFFGVSLSSSSLSWPFFVRHRHLCRRHRCLPCYHGFVVEYGILNVDEVPSRTPFQSAVLVTQRRRHCHCLWCPGTSGHS